VIRSIGHQDPKQILRTIAIHVLSLIISVVASFDLTGIAACVYSIRLAAFDSWEGVAYVLS
jgi:hypothetical protein